MIVVNVSLVSARGREHDRALGTVVISNDGTGGPGRGNYNVVASRGKCPVRPPERKLKGVYVARVEGFPRDSRSALELLRRALNALDESDGLP